MIRPRPCAKKARFYMIANMTELAAVLTLGPTEKAAVKKAAAQRVKERRAPCASYPIDPVFPGKPGERTCLRR